MAAKKAGAKKAAAKPARQRADTSPKFPYTTKPGSLRKLLKLIPGKPKPQKMDMVLLRSWGFVDNNDSTVLRVLKAVNLLNDKFETTEIYTRFMDINAGARALGPEIKRVYAPLFAVSHAPFNEPAEVLANLFNIHSGGGESALDLQIHTFKALCENASFDEVATVSSTVTTTTAATVTSSNTGIGGAATLPVVNINLHIHLPENKSRRDYEDIIEDIGRYIFGRDSGERRE